MLAKILGCQRIVEMPTGMHNNDGGSGSGSGKTAPVERKYEHLQMAINGRRREKEFRTNIKKKRERRKNRANENRSTVSKCCLCLNKWPVQGVLRCCRSICVYQQKEVIKKEEEPLTRPLPPAPVEAFPNRLVVAKAIALLSLYLQSSWRPCL